MTDEKKRVLGGRVRSMKIADDVVALQFGCHLWGIERKGNLNLLLDKRGADESTSGKKEAKYKLQKTLIVDSGEYGAIKSFMNNMVKARIVAASVPSFFREGTYLFRLGQVEDTEQYLMESSDRLRGLVDTFCKVFPSKVMEARTLLEPDGQFRVGDYPAPEYLPGLFSFEWIWVDFTVPNSLPAGVKEAAIAKMQNMWDEAAFEITNALREAFAGMIRHAVEVMTPSEDGKQKRFYDSTITNILEFLDSFQNRNVTNDQDLEMLVNKAKSVLTGVTDASLLKGDGLFRGRVLDEFSKIQRAMDSMIEVRPNRKFRIAD